MDKDISKIKTPDEIDPEFSNYYIKHCLKHCPEEIRDAMWHKYCSLTREIFEIEKMYNKINYILEQENSSE
jgi:hypothetical protein